MKSCILHIWRHKMTPGEWENVATNVDLACKNGFRAVWRQTIAIILWRQNRKAVCEQCLHTAAHRPATSRDAPCRAQPIRDQTFGAKGTGSQGGLLGGAGKTNCEMWAKCSEEFSAVLCAECDVILVLFQHPSHPNPPPPPPRPFTLKQYFVTLLAFFTSLASLFFNCYRTMINFKIWQVNVTAVILKVQFLSNISSCFGLDEKNKFMEWVTDGG